MCKHAETFHGNKDCKLTIVFFMQFHIFQNRNLGCNFQTLLERKQGVPYTYFLYENESIRHCFSYYSRKMAAFLVLDFWLFQGVRF